MITTSYDIAVDENAVVHFFIHSRQGRPDIAWCRAKVAGPTLDIQSNAFNLKFGNVPSAVQKLNGQGNIVLWQTNNANIDGSIINSVAQTMAFPAGNLAWYFGNQKIAPSSIIGRPLLHILLRVLGETPRIRHATDTAGDNVGLIDRRSIGIVQTNHKWIRLPGHALIEKSLIDGESSRYHFNPAWTDDVFARGIRCPIEKPAPPASLSFNQPLVAIEKNGEPPSQMILKS